MENIELIVITEHYSYSGESASTSIYDYNLLPKVVKDKVDEAIKNKTSTYNSQFLGDINLDGYEEGLQYLYSIDHPHIEPNNVCNFKGYVAFWCK